MKFHTSLFFFRSAETFEWWMTLTSLPYFFPHENIFLVSYTLFQDPLAKEIISRVDNSSYGVKGRKREDIALSFGAKVYPPQFSENFPPTQPKPLDLTSTQYVHSSVCLGRVI